MQINLKTKSPIYVYFIPNLTANVFILVQFYLNVFKIQ